MNREDFFRQVSEKIKCKRAFPMIRDELELHIDEQKRSLLEEGMSQEDAEMLAVKEMGSPKEIGERLNIIHRPKTEWSLIIMVVLLSIAGIVIQCLAFKGVNNYDISQTYKYRTIIYNLIGLLAMTGVIFWDYRILEKKVYKVYAAYLVACVALAFINDFNNTGYYYAQGNFLSVMFVPVFAGFVYRFSSEGLSGIVKLLAIIGINVFIMRRLTYSSLALWFIAAFSCILCIILAIIKGYFNGNKVVLFSLCLGALLAIPVFMYTIISFNLYDKIGMSEYQAERMKAYFFNFNQYPDSFGYLPRLVRGELEQASLFGSGGFGKLLDIAYTDYILVCIASYFGIFALAVVMCIFCILSIKSLIISFRQKNSFGSILASSSAIIIILKAIFYFLVNMGVLNATSNDMPFLSFGLWSTLANYILMGIILAVYRNSSVFMERKKPNLCTKTENEGILQ